MCVTVGFPWQYVGNFRRNKSICQQRGHSHSTFALIQRHHHQSQPEPSANLRRAELRHGKVELLRAYHVFPDREETSI